MVYNNEAYGWKDKLRNPKHELPGSYAVDNENHIFIANGDNGRASSGELIQIDGCRHH